MVRWPAKIKLGVSDASVCHIGKSKDGRESFVLGNVGLSTSRKCDYILIPPHKGSKIN